MFLARDATPNTASKDGRTSSVRAVINGNEVITRMSFEREDITLNTANKYGETLVSWGS